MALKNISAAEAKALLEKNDGSLVVLDVRTPQEFTQARIKGAVCIDIYQPSFSDDISALDRNKRYLIYCRTGQRSMVALSLFSRLGFSEAYNMLGGILAWAHARYPIER